MMNLVSYDLNEQSTQRRESWQALRRSNATICSEVWSEAVSCLTIILEGTQQWGNPGCRVRYELCRKICLQEYPI
jgi:hypothetical protein